MGIDIAVTGLFGAGSSAVLDLLSEYECNGTGIKDDKGGYEHTTLYHPGGLFDLEDKLLLCNDSHRSDEALTTFETEMKRLNKYNFGWFGSFKTMFGDKFERNVESFIDNLHPFEMNNRYYGQCKKVIFNPLKIPVQFAAKILVGRTIYKWGRQFIHVPAIAKMKVAFPSEEEFYSSARLFVRNYMDMFKEKDKENTLFDRIILNQHVNRIPRYFDDNFRLILVNRDVRDVYVLNKYIWPVINAGTMYPTNLKSFIDYWQRVNNYQKNELDERVLQINFEDLIYKNEETIKRIEEHCQLSSEKHVLKNMYLDISKSIKNTQVYKVNEQWKEEILLIEKELPQYCYNFPYNNTTEIKDMFDNSRSVSKRGLLQKIMKGRE